MKSKLIIFAIILLATALRLYDVTWDQGYHLHPDERFLTMVATNMHLPTSLTEYLTPEKSPFNPTNVGFPFFVYGAFPLILAKTLAPFFYANNYDGFTSFGRILSAIADTLVVLILFKFMTLFEKRYQLHQSIKFFAAGLYSIAVLPIQLAHFFAVDSFLNLFVLTTLYCMSAFAFQKKKLLFFCGAIFLGLAIATKITGIVIIPLLLCMLLPRQYPKKFTLQQFGKGVFFFLGYCLLTYITLRLADPYLFQNLNFFDPHPNMLFLKNLQTLKNLSDPTAWFPPALQWLHTTPVLFALQNIVFFGLGIPFFLCVIVGIGVILMRYRKTKLLLLLSWCLLIFLYQSTQITKTMRYFIVIYPFLALFGALGFHFLTKRFHPSLIVLTCIPLLIWPFSFLSIYTKDHSRVIASRFIYETIPSNSIILSEHWDDALPLQISNSEKTFTIKELPVFGQDNYQKWNDMDALLAQGDYLILSSNRGWGSILAAPERYPMMAKFYKDLFADKLAYKKIATFTSYPSLTYLGVPITFPDDDAEEAFTVYDHPKIMIFQKQKN